MLLYAEYQYSKQINTKNVGWHKTREGIYELCIENFIRKLQVKRQLGRQWSITLNDNTEINLTEVRCDRWTALKFLRLWQAASRY